MAKRYDALVIEALRKGPQTILEIGMSSGVKACRIVGAALQCRDEVMLYGFGKFGGGVGRAGGIEAVFKRLERFGASIDAVLVDGDPLNTLPDRVESMDDIDFAFVTGVEEVERGMAYWHHVEKVLAVDGVAVLDNCWDSDEFGMRPVVNKLMESGKWKIRRLKPADQYSKGLQVVRVGLVAVERL